MSARNDVGAELVTVILPVGTALAVVLAVYAIGVPSPQSTVKASFAVTEQLAIKLTGTSTARKLDALNSDVTV